MAPPPPPYTTLRITRAARAGTAATTVYEKMADGLADIGIIKKPYPPKSAIFDGSFVQAAASQ